MSRHKTGGQHKTAPASRIARRAFLAGTSAAAFTIVKPSQVRGTEANSTVALGLLGCGGRGTWIVPLFQQHGRYRLVACADYYPDRLEAAGRKFEVPENRRYAGLSGYKKLVEDKLDAVVIETPPYFHPEQAAAAVDAGKHVYLAKPIAVDVPGCRSIAESGRKATEGKLAFLVDFQTRADAGYRELARRLHGGMLGKMVSGDAKYPTGHLGMTAPQSPEDRLRHWYCVKALSGDFIVEQSIHALDVATWFLDAAPVRCWARGGSRGLRTYGDIWDYFQVLFEFPNDFPLTFHCIQNVHGSPNEIRCRIYGEKATVDSDYFSGLWWRGQDAALNMEADFKKSYGDVGLYTGGTIVNIREYYECITGGRFDNPTVAPSVRSNLTAIMGRNAAYSGEPLTWDALMKSEDRLEPDLKGLKA